MAEWNGHGRTPATKYPIQVGLAQYKFVFIACIDLCGLQVRLQAVLSILLATFAGIGVAMSGSSILVELLRWKRRRRAQLEHHPGSQVTSRPSQFPRSVNPPWVSPSERRHQTEVGNPETYSVV